MIPQFEIQYNPEFPRFEVFGPDSQIRNHERQPQFVSTNYMDCHRYIENVEASR